MSERARRLFEELTPPPSEREAWVLMTTTAGFSGESQLLESLYQTGLQGTRLPGDLKLYRAGTLTMFWVPHAAPTVAGLGLLHLATPDAAAECVSAAPPE